MSPPLLAHSQLHMLTRIELHTRIASPPPSVIYLIKINYKRGAHISCTHSSIKIKLHYLNRPVFRSIPAWRCVHKHRRASSLTNCARVCVFHNGHTRFDSVNDALAAHSKESRPFRLQWAAARSQTQKRARAANKIPFLFLCFSFAVCVLLRYFCGKPIDNQARLTASVCQHARACVCVCNKRKLTCRSLFFSPLVRNATSYFVSFSLLFWGFSFFGASASSFPSSLDPRPLNTLHTYTHADRGGHVTKSGATLNYFIDK